MASFLYIFPSLYSRQSFFLFTPFFHCSGCGTSWTPITWWSGCCTCRRPSLSPPCSSMTRTASTWRPGRQLCSWPGSTVSCSCKGIQRSTKLNIQLLLRLSYVYINKTINLKFWLNCCYIKKIKMAKNYMPHFCKIYNTHGKLDIQFYNFLLSKLFVKCSFSVIKTHGKVQRLVYLAIQRQILSSCKGYHLVVSRRFDVFGIYVVMFLEILATLFQALCVFSILLVAFGLAFSILLRHEVKPKLSLPHSSNICRT